MTKPRIFKNLGKLDKKLIADIKLKYPYGFDKKLIMIPFGKKLISVLPYETESLSYLIKASLKEAQELYRLKVVEKEDEAVYEELDINEIIEIEGEEKEKVPKKRGRKPKQKEEEKEQSA